MHFSPDAVLSRADRFINDRLAKFIHTKLADTQILVYEPDLKPTYLTDGKDNVMLDPKKVIKLFREKPSEFKPYKVGEPYGSVWGNSWFRVSGKIDKKAKSSAKVASTDPLELLFDLGWQPHSPGFHVEAMAYTNEGEPFKALHPMNGWLRLDQVLKTDGSFEIFIEAASNPLVMDVKPFVETDLGEGPFYDENIRYRIMRSDVAALREQIYGFWLDFEVLRDLVRELPADSPRRHKIAYSLEQAMNVYDERRSDETISDARAKLASVLASPAAGSEMNFHAVGHAHIDTAWLWPYRETRRKMARTIANVLALMDIYPNWTYALSAAQHYAWLEEDQPQLFKRLATRIKEKRIIPVGGAWVESDGVIPTGESMVRQHLYGQRYFKEKFGVTVQLMWLPDSFGYSSAFPSIGKRAGFKWFLTQKISWGDTTKFPHHSFFWQGLDGTRMFTHFPPSDTYNASITPAEMKHGSENYQEKAISNNQFMLFGYGDGGGGPTREMIERGLRMHGSANGSQGFTTVNQTSKKHPDFNKLGTGIEGNGRFVFANPNEFFANLEQEVVQNCEQANQPLPLWAGDFYLEFHRGTLTSQRAMKKLNRIAESTLRDCEYLATRAALLTNFKYPYEDLVKIWHSVLTNQFHDVLPGSSIAWAHRDAKEIFEQAIANAEDIAISAIAKLTNRSVKNVFEKKNIIERSVKEYADFLVSESIGDKPQKGKLSPNKTIILCNEFITLKINHKGHIVSCFDHARGRELVPFGHDFAVFQLFEDKPTQWDAWDIDRSALRTAQSLEVPSSIELTDNNTVKITYKVDSSVFQVEIILQQCSVQFDIEVDWHHCEKLLKFALPLAISTNKTIHETQYGLLERPVHSNTSADEAKFETAWHRFMMVNEHDYSLGIINDCIYGVDTTPIEASKKSPAGVLVRPSLLKAAKFPDPQQDQGKHTFRLAIIPNTDFEFLYGMARILNGTWLHFVREEIDAVTEDETADPSRQVLPETDEDDLVNSNALVELAGDDLLLDDDNNIAHEQHIKSAEDSCKLRKQFFDDAIIDWVKMAEDGSGDVIVRIYEPVGTVANVTLAFHKVLRNHTITEVDMLEGQDFIKDLPKSLVYQNICDECDCLQAFLTLQPFQIVTLRLSKNIANKTTATKKG